MLRMTRFCAGKEEKQRPNASLLLIVSANPRPLGIRCIQLEAEPYVLSTDCPYSTSVVDCLWCVSTRCVK